MRTKTTCPICGDDKALASICLEASKRESLCPNCHAPRRSCDLMRVLLKEHDGLEDLAKLNIYELQATGPIHRALSAMPGYACSEYLPGVAFGAEGAAGVRNEDATALTFSSGSFDLVISQDVMEHIEDTWLAFAEINRVLRPGGKHIFTVPLHEGKATCSRLGQGDVYHGDPLNQKGALVYWDFGDDLPKRLADLRIKASLALHESFYAPENICRIDSPKAHAEYLEAVASKGKARIFFYNSTVFIAEKI